MAEPKIIKVYEAYQELDTEEGKGGRTSLGIFFNENIAKTMAIGKGVHGGDGQVVTRVALQLSNDLVFLLASEKPVNVFPSTQEAFRASGRNKLTPEEIKALGL